MSVINQLRPFVSLGQACGFIPFVMENDPKTQRFARFNFSWNNFVTWLFIFMAISQLVVPLEMSRLLIDTGGGLMREAPVTVKMLMYVTFLSYAIQLILARWIILRQHNRLQNVVKLVLQVEESLKDQSLNQISVVGRFLIGFGLLTISVSLFPPFFKLITH